ncbi:MAG: helix-turn-helix domain-containing protein [Coriobacteriia bacterium]|nr:helix-turn-helix domain-containing protein [Coriobacteriia bacterium]
MTAKKKVSPELKKLLDAVTGKRPRTVVDHILKHGHITSQELKDIYGYNHPPRAVRDVREQGVPIDTIRILGSDGRKIAAYTFGDPSKIIAGRLNGRAVIPKEFKQRLCEAHDSRCAVCYGPYDERYLQADHRVPYEVAGDQSSESWALSDFMPVCGSCNRAKSWSCEHCANWVDAKDPDVCRRCYWASPEDYDHVAGTTERRAVVVWQDAEIVFFDEIASGAIAAGMALDEYLKRPKGSEPD